MEIRPIVKPMSKQDLLRNESLHSSHLVCPHVHNRKTVPGRLYTYFLDNHKALILQQRFQGLEIVWQLYMYVGHEISKFVN